MAKEGLTETGKSKRAFDMGESALGSPTGAQPHIGSVACVQLQLAYVASLKCCARPMFPLQFIIAFAGTEGGKAAWELNRERMLEGGAYQYAAVCWLACALSPLP
jgi:hypothetical protein